MNEMEIYRCQMQRGRETPVLPLHQFQYPPPPPPYLPYRAWYRATKIENISRFDGKFITRYFEIVLQSFLSILQDSTSKSIRPRFTVENIVFQLSN